MKLSKTRKKSSKEKRYKKINCSANKKSFTCYSNKSLNLMKKYWNTRHPDTKITSDKPRDIWKQFKKYFHQHTIRVFC